MTALKRNSSVVRLSIDDWDWYLAWRVLHPESNTKLEIAKEPLFDTNLFEKLVGGDPLFCRFDKPKIPPYRMPSFIVNDRPFNGRLYFIHFPVPISDTKRPLK